MIKPKKGKRIDKRNDRLQRRDVIRVSKAKDTAYVFELLILLDADNTTYDNRRHIVRALGNIADKRCEPVLLNILRNGNGVIVGEAAEALGKLRCKQAIPRLKQLTTSGTGLVAQKSRWALKQLAE